MNSPMSRNTRNAEAGTLCQRNVCRKLSDLLERNRRILGGRAKGTVGLSAITPHPATQPFPRHAFAHRVNRARTIAVRYDTWIRHSDAKGILAFLDLAGIYA